MNKASTKGTDTENAVLARESERGAALLAADVEALADLLSDRLVFAHANATYDDKASLLAKMRSGNIVYQSLEVSGQRVIDLGDSALLVSRLRAAVTVGGQPRYRQLDAVSVDAGAQPVASGRVPTDSDSAVKRRVSRPDPKRTGD